MAEKLTYDINVGGNAVQSIGNVKKALKEANAELINAQANFGDYSQEAIAAAKRVAELKDRVTEARETADLFDPGKKFQAFAGAVNAVAGGFTAVQGALGLIGVESEEVQKSLLKVQSALALSQGLNAITDSAKDFQRLAATLKKDVVSAFNAVKTAIGATGIGALLLALGAIVTFWDDIKEAVSGVSAEQKKLTEDTNKNVKAQQEKLSAIDSQENILKLQGKSEREILDIKIKQTDEVISATEKQLAQQKVVLQAQLSAEKRNKEILQGILTFITAPLQLVIDAVNKVAQTFGKGFDFNIADKISTLVFDPKETEKKGNEELAAIDKTLNELKNKRAGFQLSIQAINKQAADKFAETEAARLEKQLADEKKLTDDLLAEYDKRRKVANNAKILSQKELNALDEQDRIKKQEEENKKFATQQDNLKKIGSFTYDSIVKDQKLKEDARQAELQADIALQDAKFEAVSAGLNLLSSLAGQNEKIANAIFVIDKALAIAKIVVDTQREIAGYYATYSALGPKGLIAATKFSLAAKIRAGAGIASIAATSIAKFKGGGSAGGVGGGASAPSVSADAPLAPPQPQTTTLSNQSINALGNQATRAYVIESDVTSSQQRIAAIQQRARFG
jgi:hypothetical protein